MTQIMVENVAITELLGNDNLKVQPSYHYTLTLPDHTQLPDKDGTFVKNFQEHPQSILLTDSIMPKLRVIQPDNQFAIGQDCGIYWRLSEPGEPPSKGAEAPDWFYVPNVPPMLDGACRRSYVMWQEHVPPLIALEFVSGNGSEERDKTPYQGKFWIYEQAIRIPYYGIYEVKKASIEMYQWVAGRYELMQPNVYGQYDIPELDAAIGIWRGEYNHVTLPWMRWWDRQGNLLPTSEEQLQTRYEQLQIERQAKELANQRAEQERLAKELANQWAEQECQAKEQERQAKELAQQELAELHAKLRELGIAI